MMINKSFSQLKRVYKTSFPTRCYVTAGCQNILDRELTSSMKYDIENHWKDKLGCNKFDPTSEKPKKYVLAMFPYPSGNLHMGHVRVYTISDAMARYYRLNGNNVLHPMGWDAFGLPAENAAIQRKIPADIWTKQNIGCMRKQLELLQCSFDWSRELATCDPTYYKWTQKLFLMMFEDGLAYQKEALVKWDPVDKTVLADEQVDANGCSWRSGAKVENKLLRQWFVKTTKFGKPLYDGLADPSLEDWRGIIKVQKHWIGKCNGFRFELKLENRPDTISIWTINPEHLKYAEFVCLHPIHILNVNKMDEGPLGLEVLNPITGRKMPLLISNSVEFPFNCDTFLGVPSVPDDANAELDRKEVAKVVDFYPVSSKLKDWLISRQRYWGAPIPIIHCKKCGSVPVPDENLPVTLADMKEKKTECPKCGSADALRESDTMDTFVDSSWYFLRFLDSKNETKIFDEKIATKMMPIDLYVGGKEHAELHLYYARFISHYLHSRGLVPQAEPFKRLLVQGMVMGQSFRVKDSGKYLTAAEVDVVDAKKNKAVEKSTGAEVITAWEKMSKSKLNGVDPNDVIKEHGCDTLRLIMLADVAPTSHRNWSSATFPGILNWQKRMWRMMHDYTDIRSKIEEYDKGRNSQEFVDQDHKLYDSRNYFAAGTTFNYKYSHQLSVAVSKMQGLSNTIRRATPVVVAYSKQYERAVAALLIMVAPMAPHFASELWSRFAALPNRLNGNSAEINWDCDVLQQNWPVVDDEFELDLTLEVNKYECLVMKFPKTKLNQLTHQGSLDLAIQQAAIIEKIEGKTMKTTDFSLYPNYQATLNITI